MADHFHMGGSFVTTIMGKLIECWLVVKKKPDPVDGRRVRLNFPKEGREAHPLHDPTGERMRRT